MTSAESMETVACGVCGESVMKRDQIAFESIKYMSEKTKGLSF